MEAATGLASCPGAAGLMEYPWLRAPPLSPPRPLSVPPPNNTGGAASTAGAVVPAFLRRQLMPAESKYTWEKMLITLKVWDKHQGTELAYALQLYWGPFSHKQTVSSDTWVLVGFCSCMIPGIGLCSRIHILSFLIWQ